VPIDQAGRDPVARERIEGRLAGEGLHALVAELRGSAPAVADATDLANPRRVVRALERVAIHGDRPPPAPSSYPGPVLWLGLSVEAPTHRRWIEDRARGQFSGGLIDEAQSLLARYPASLPAFSAIGYREAFDVLAGCRTEAEGAEAAAGRTWAYARRQRTWFRREPDVTWLDATEGSASEVAIDRVRRFLGA
jgi:tRNA dimethylallyltransferase